MTKTKKFLDDALLYSTSNILCNILNFITGIVVRRVLQPMLMGFFNEIMLIFEYVRYAQLGFIQAMDKELPYFYGRKDSEKVEMIKNTGFSVCLANTALICLIIFIGTFIVKFEDKLLVNGIRIVFIMVILRLISSLYLILCRSHNNFPIISKYTILSASVDIIFKVILTMKFGLYGLLWASVLTAASGLVYFYYTSNIRFKFIILKLPYAEVGRLFKVGFPLFILGFVAMTLQSIDRIMILKLLGKVELGYYTIALMVSAYIIQLPNLIYAVIFPRFYQAYGKSEDIIAVRGIFMKPIFIFAYLFPILIGITILCLPILIEYILPSYKPGVPPARLLLFGASFIALLNMPGYLLTVLNKQIYMVIIAVFAVIFAVILNYGLVCKFHLGLSGIAISMTVTYFLYATVLLAYAFRHYTKKFLDLLKFFAQIYFPFIWITIWLVLLGAFSYKFSGIILKDLTFVLYKSLVFVALCTPLVLYCNRKTAIVSILRNVYLKKR